MVAWSTYARAQPPTPPAKVDGGPSGSVSDSLVERDRSAIEKIADQAQKTVDTALLIWGGSIAVLLSTGYHRPKRRALRLLYLLFPVGWFAFARSVYFASDIRAVQHAYLLSPPRSMADRFERLDILNTGSISQTQWFYGGLIVFAVWLLVYLTWWIATDEIQDKAKKEA